MQAVIEQRKETRSNVSWPVSVWIPQANRFVVATELDHLISVQSLWLSYYPFICLFLILLGIIIVLINHSGGAYAYSNFISKKLHSAAAAEKCNHC